MNENLRERVKALLAEHRISRKALASKSGLSQSTISSFLSGRRLNPSINTLEKLADVLGCKVVISFENVGFSC